MYSQRANNVKSSYENLTGHASDCVECGVCEPGCPFNVEIINQMKQDAELFGK